MPSPRWTIAGTCIRGTIEVPNLSGSEYGRGPLSDLGVVMRTLIAIDPGNDTGWSLWILSFADTGPVAHLSACGLGKVPVGLWFGEVSILIEVPQVYPEMPVPAKDLITLAMNAGRHVEAVRTARRAMGLHEPKAYGVYPARWKGQVRKEAHHAQMRKALPASDLRTMDTSVAAYPTGKRHNVLDAVALGHWAIERIIALHTRGADYVLRASCDYVFPDL